MPKISVITPIYKTEQYLDKCLQSLIAQTLSDIEFIWVDNGASDQCREIIKKYETQRSNIKVIHLETNKGYSGAMNAGLDAAEGDYIGFCDSDDWVDADYYEKLYLATQNGKFDIAFAEYKIEFDDHSAASPHLSHNAAASTLKEKIDILKNGAIWDKIFKKSLIDHNNIRFFENSRSYYEDNVLLMQAAIFANAIATTAESYYHYVQHASSVINNKSLQDERIRYSLRVIAFIINLLISKQLNNEEKLSGLNFINRSLPLKKLLKQTSLYNALLEQITHDDFIISQLSELYSSLHLPWFKRIFYIQNNMFGNNIYLLGFKMKLKKGKSK